MQNYNGGSSYGENHVLKMADDVCMIAAPEHSFSGGEGRGGGDDISNSLERILNKYHNNLHGADVFQTVLYFCGKYKDLSGDFSSLEFFSLLLAAYIHDFNHPGLNTSYVITDWPASILSTTFGPEVLYYVIFIKKLFYFKYFFFIYVIYNDILVCIRNYFFKVCFIQLYIYSPH